MNDINVQAFSEFVSAGEVYLVKNGWERASVGKWKAPNHMGIFAGDVYFHWHCIKMQYQYDSNELR